MDTLQDKTMQVLQQLSGVWIGEGTGEYPTIDPFRYREEITFTSAAGKMYLHYSQRTWRVEPGGQETPSHWETGFWRALPNGDVELLCAQASGRLEAARGRLIPTPDGLLLSLLSDQFANDTRVEQSRREFDLNGSTLRYTHKMQTTAVPALTLHVQAELHRQPGG